jgi:hypothetical protein
MLMNMPPWVGVPLAADGLEEGHHEVVDPFGGVGLDPVAGLGIRSTRTSGTQAGSGSASSRPG